MIEFGGTEMILLGFLGLIVGGVANRSLRKPTTSKAWRALIAVLPLAMILFLVSDAGNQRVWVVPFAVSVVLLGIGLAAMRLLTYDVFRALFGHDRGESLPPRTQVPPRVGPL